MDGKYNTKVRQAISDQYVECLNNKAEAMKEFEKNFCTTCK